MGSARKIEKRAVTKWKSLHGKAEIKNKRCAVRFVLSTCDFVHAHADLCAYKHRENKALSTLAAFVSLLLLHPMMLVHPCATCKDHQRVCIFCAVDVSVQCNYVSTCSLMGVFICAVTSLKFITSL